MYKQFSYIEPLQTSERLYKEMKTTKKFKHIRQNINYYKEHNWINAWPKNQCFSNILRIVIHFGSCASTGGCWNFSQRLELLSKRINQNPWKALSELP